MKVNPLYFRRDKGWPLRNFLKKGGLFGAAFGIAILFGQVLLCIDPHFYPNTFPYKIISDLTDIIFWGEGFGYIMLFSLIAEVALYHALLGMFAGFLANALFCIYKKVKINEEDNNSIDYLDFSKKITKAEVRRFFVYGVLLTILIIAILSYFLWDWNFSEWLFSFFESFYK